MPRIIKCRIGKVKQTRHKERSFISPILLGGIGLACLQLKLFSLKIIDFYASDMSDQNSFLPTKFNFPKEIENFLRNTNIYEHTKYEKNSSDIATISNFTNSRLIITLQTKSREVYCFCLRNCSFQRAAISRLWFAANRYLCSEEKLLQTVISVQKKNTGKVWKNSILDVWEKKIFFS